MKITFLMPPALKGKAPERIFGCNYGLFYQPNIFILYPSAMLEKKRHKVVVLDCPLEKISWDKLKNYLKNDNSDLYVFYTVFLAEETDRHAVEVIRETVGNVPIIFMGPEPTSRPNDFTLDENTFVARGEAEYTIMDFISNMKSKNFKQIKGLTWMDDGKIVHNPPRELIKDLDKLPFPARHLIKKELYYNPKLQGRPSTVMLTSRNCYGRCIYCIPCSYMFAREIEHKRFFNCKPPVRVRSPKNIYEEFKLVKKQGYKAIAIIDDNFLGLKGQEERIIKLCELIKPLKMEWGCLARADQLQNEKVIKDMANAGCVYVDVGAESFDQKVLDFVHKDLKVGDIFNAIFLLKKYGIEPKINILFGTSPYETEESVKWTVKILKELNIDWVSFDVTIPHPQTEFYKIVKQNRWFGTESNDYTPVDPMRRATVDFPNLKHEKLESLVKWAYREYYLRPQYIWKRLSKIRNFQDFKELVQTARRLFF